LIASFCFRHSLLALSQWLPPTRFPLTVTGLKNNLNGFPFPARPLLSPLSPPVQEKSRTSPSFCASLDRSASALSPAFYSCGFSKSSLGVCNQRTLALQIVLSSQSLYARLRRLVVATLFLPGYPLIQMYFFFPSGAQGSSPISGSARCVRLPCASPVFLVFIDNEAGPPCLPISAVWTPGSVVNLIAFFLCLHRSSAYFYFAQFYSFPLAFCSPRRRTLFPLPLFFKIRMVFFHLFRSGSTPRSILLHSAY